MKVIAKLAVAAAIAISAASSGAAAAPASVQHPPWFQSVEYFDAYGQMIGERRWYCDGRVVDWGILAGSYEEWYFYYECS